jgi:Vacuolar protein sorting-associated protein 62
MTKHSKVIAMIAAFAILSIVSPTPAQGSTDNLPDIQFAPTQIETQAPVIEMKFVSEYQLKYWDKGSGADHDGAFYQPVVPEGYYPLGSYGQGNYGAPLGPIFVARELVLGALAAPVDYAWIWDDSGSGADMDGSFWRPIPAGGYTCLGDVAQTGWGKPNLDAIRCVRSDLVVPAEPSTDWIWIDQGSGADDDFGAWRIIPSVDNAIFLGTFIGNSHWSPPGIPLFTLRSDAIVMPAISQAEVNTLVQQYGPLIYYHPDELYFMDSPEWGLDHGIMLNWALVENEMDYSGHLETYFDTMQTSNLTFMDDVNYVLNEIKPNPPYANSDLFKLWLNIPDELKPGDQSRADALVRAVSWNTVFTEIQFWYFYPYNGPGRVEVCLSGSVCDYIQMDTVGRHYGDWEHVSLVFDTSTKELAYVYLSAHSGGNWFPKSAFGSGLTFYETTHPIIYAAKYSHAFYATEGYHDYMRVKSYDYGFGTFSVDLYDLTGMGAQFQAYLPENYRIISSAFSPWAGPEWLGFTGRWGQYEKLSYNFDYTVYEYSYEEVGAGPLGLNMKTAWQVGEFGDFYGWPENPVNLFKHIYLPVTLKSD